MDDVCDFARFRLNTSRPGDYRRNIPFWKQSLGRQDRGRFSDRYNRITYVSGEHVPPDD